MATFDFGGLLGSNMFGGGDMGLDEYLTPEQRARMNNQGIMALAASLLKSSGPSAVPIGLGQALGEAYGAGQTGYQQAQTGAIANIMTKQKLDEFKRAKDIEDQIAKIQARTGSSMPTAGVAITPDQALLLPNMPAGPTQRRADMIGQIPTAGAAVTPMSENDLQYQKYMDMSRVYSRDPAKAKAYQDLAMQLKPTEEFSTTPQYGLSAAGTPISFVLNKSGGMKLLDVQRNPEYNYQDAGGYISVRDKTTNKEIERISKTLAPQVVGNAETGFFQLGGGGGGGRRAPSAAPAAQAVAPGAVAVNVPQLTDPKQPNGRPLTSNQLKEYADKYFKGDVNAGIQYLRKEGWVEKTAATPAAAAPGVGNVLGLVPLIPGTGAASKSFTNEGDLRKEYTTQMKPFTELGQAFRKIEATALNPSTAGDISLVYNFMKILDPGSTVMQGEQATATNAGSIPERIRAQYNKALTGEGFTPEIRQDFYSQAKNLIESQRELQQDIAARYSAIATQNKLDPNRVVFDPFQRIKTPQQQISDAANKPLPKRRKEWYEGFDLIPAP